MEDEASMRCEWKIRQEGDPEKIPTDAEARKRWISMGKWRAVTVRSHCISGFDCKAPNDARFLQYFYKKANWDVQD
jgi:hypothetical protein